MEKREGEKLNDFFRVTKCGKVFVFGKQISQDNFRSFFLTS
jgi:hypothetical protein